MIKYFITPQAATIFGKKQLIVPCSHFNFERIVDLLKGGCQDEEKIFRLYDLNTIMQEEFSEYVMLNENNRLVLRACPSVDMEIFTRDVLRMKSKHGDVAGFFAFLSYAGENKNCTIKDILHFLRVFNAQITIIGTLNVYAATDSNWCELKSSQLHANSIVSVNPRNLIVSIAKGESKVNVADLKPGQYNVEIFREDGDTTPLPDIADCNLINGDDLLDCF